MDTPKKRGRQGRYPGQVLALQRAVLTRLAIHGVITAACREARCGYGTFQKWRKENPVFEEQVQHALRSSSDRIVLEAHRRGIAGHDEPVIHQGQIQYVTEPVWDETAQEWRRQYVLGEDGKPIPLTTKKFSDRMLEKMLEARGPDEFKRKVEVTGANGTPLIPESNSMDAARMIAFALAQGMQLASRPRVELPPIETREEQLRVEARAARRSVLDPDRELEVEEVRMLEPEDWELDDWRKDERAPRDEGQDLC